MSAAPAVHGRRDARFRAVREVFEDAFARGDEVGAAVAEATYAALDA
jgi:hypothetical protein